MNLLESCLNSLLYSAAYRFVIIKHPALKSGAIHPIMNTKSFPHLFCKPPFHFAQGDTTTKILFNKFYPEIKGTISFRSLDLKEDLKLIHEWVHQHYAHEYWQMNGHFSQLYAIYQCVELNSYAHSFIGCFAPLAMTSLTPDPSQVALLRSARNDAAVARNDERVICQFDVYSVFADELREHVNGEQHDCGFHLLMAPNKNPLPGLTPCIVKAFLEYYFSFPEAKRMYAEPDMNNEKSIKLLERCGFEKIKTIEMSYKKAHVYCLEKQVASSLRSSQ